MMAKKPVDPTSKPTYFPNKSKQVKKQTGLFKSVKF